MISLSTWQAALTVAARPRPEARQPTTCREAGAGARRELGTIMGWEGGMKPVLAIRELGDVAMREGVW